MMSRLAFVLGSFAILGFSQSAQASFFAICDFEIVVTKAERSLKLVASTIYTRDMEGVIVKATSPSPSHEDCEPTYTGKKMVFPLQVKNSEANLKRLGEIKVEDNIKVHFVKTDGLTPWGVVSSEDWVLSEN
jgi:hypothetical protein